MNNIGSRLKQVRTVRGKSQKELAALLGIPFRTLQDCEQGKTLPSATTLAAYSIIGIDLNWIVAGQNNNSDNRALPIETIDPDNTNTLSDQLIPIPWFAADDIRKSYIVDEKYAHQTARIAIHHSEISRYIDRKHRTSTDQVHIASTTISFSDTDKPNETTGLILFDLHDTEPTHPGYFVCADGELLLVKRLQKLSRAVMISIGAQISDPVIVEPKLTRVIGRVVGNI